MATGRGRHPRYQRPWCGAADQRLLWDVITMYYRDHEPPHFHAIYGEHEAQVVIEP